MRHLRARLRVVTGERHTSEGAFNSLFAQALLRRCPGWAGHLNAEQSRVLRGARSKRPDIVLAAGSEAATVIEIEYDDSPPESAEADALARLGTQLATGAFVEHVVALRVPAFLASLDQSELTDAFDAVGTAYSYCSLARAEVPGRDDPDAEHAAASVERFPANGWIEGALDDLVGFIETTAVSEQAVEEGTMLLEDAVNFAAQLVMEECRRGPKRLVQMAKCLQQEPGLQTVRMAMAVLANACIVHRAIAEAHDIKDFAQLRAHGVKYGRRFASQMEFLDEWWHIMHEVDYWPIFSLASDVLGAMPVNSTSPVLWRMMALAESLGDLGTVTTGDLAGQAIGRLITDRKFLATFYTLPSSAALLAELAVRRLPIEPEGDRLADSLRIADLACGTGTLLSAVYRRVAARCRRQGADDRALHRHMVEEVFVGADIMPAATHLTVAQLSAAHPEVTFTQTNVHTMPYGEHTLPGDDKPQTSIGSLDLLGSDVQLSVFGTGEESLGGGGSVSGHGPEGRGRLNLAAESLDLCIMNPPFTRPTTKETAEQRGVPVPSFAGFETSIAEQHAMSRELKRLGKQLPHRQVGHGNAGLATNFIDLAHLKTKPGGVLALVIPAAFAAGAAWSGVRRLLAEEYRDIVVVSIAAVGSTDRAFSADTGMAEVLVVATRRDDLACTRRPTSTGCTATGTDRGAESASQDDVLWVNLRSRPAGIVAGVEIARSIRSAGTDAAGRLRVGGDTVATYVRAPLSAGGCAAAQEADVARAALGLSRGELHLPRLPEVSMPLVPLDALGRPGPYHLDIKSTGNTARGPFLVEELSDEVAASYPMLWAHDADRERRLQVMPDGQGRVVEGEHDKALSVWATATRLHCNLDFRVNSQPLAACLTPDPAIGGRAWPSFILDDRAWEPFIALWLNSTLGLINFWFLGTRQQSGRTILSLTRVGELLVPDPRQLSDTQLALAESVADTYADTDLLPANEAWRDEARQQLDELLLIDMLGLERSVLDSLALTRTQWCAEPSVHGGKGTAPG